MSLSVLIVVCFVRVVNFVPAVDRWMGWATHKSHLDRAKTLQIRQGYECQAQTGDFWNVARMQGLVKQW